MRPAPVLIGCPPRRHGAETAEHQGKTPWQSMLDRLVEVVQEGENPGRSRGG
jgi:hypothetical protein